MWAPSLILVMSITTAKDSPCIDAGGPLTTITSTSGSGTTFEVANANYFIDGWGGKFRSARTLERWRSAYKHSGFKVLQVKGREDRGQPRALDEELKEQIAALRKAHTELTVKSLIKELYRREILTPGAPPSASTLYRFLREVNLDKRSLNAGVLSGPTKAFEHALSNDLQSAVKKSFITHPNPNR